MAKKRQNKKQQQKRKQKNPNPPISFTRAPQAIGGVVTARRDGRLSVRHREPITFLKPDGNRTTKLGEAARIPAGQALTDDLHVALPFAVIPVLLSLANAALPLAARLGKVFAKSLLHSAIVEFVPDAATTVAGQIPMGFNPDPVDQTPQTASDVANLPTSVTTQAWRPSKMAIPPRDLAGWRYNHSRPETYGVIESTNSAEIRQESFGKIFIAVPKNDGTGDFPDGTVYLNYHATFADPVLGSNGTPGPTDEFRWIGDGDTADKGGAVYCFPVTVPSNAFLKPSNVVVGGVTLPTLICTRACVFSVDLTCSGPTRPYSVNTWIGSGTAHVLEWKQSGDTAVASAQFNLNVGEALTITGTGGGALDGYIMDIDCRDVALTTTGLTVPDVWASSYPRYSKYQYNGVSFTQNTNTVLFTGVDLAAHPLFGKYNTEVLESMFATNFTCILTVDKTAITPVLIGYVTGTPLAPTHVIDNGAAAIFVWENVGLVTSFVYITQDSFRIQNTAATVANVSGFVYFCQTRGTIDGVLV